MLRAIGALVGLLLLTLPLYLAYATALGGDDSGYAYGYSKRRGKRQADGGEEGEEELAICGTKYGKTTTQ